MNDTVRPWPALWALLIGFFMILVDTTIVAIATPAILGGLHTDLNAVMWVTSAYLLAYAVPLLVTGRLGDRFGPKRIYLIGLVVFVAASLGCGLAPTIGMLIAARAVQGLGAAFVTPQTMAVITRIFPPQGRGAAMGVWGSVAGIATLVGPILGGVLVDAASWRWIFFINVPIGIVGFIAAMRLVPVLETRARRFDWIGVLLSAVGMFLLVFGIQEGQAHQWGAVAGPVTAWVLIVGGIVVLAAFVVWQRFTRTEPLVPLSLFRDRNFSLANGAIFMVGLAITALPVPLAFYFQVARGLEPTAAALMLAPMAVVSGILAPFVGRFADRVGSRWVSFGAFVLASLALLLYSALMGAHTPLPLLLLPSALLGVGTAGIFAPLASTATHDLPRSQAGAGAGVYSATRQVGSVLGAAAVAALLGARLAAELPGIPAAVGERTGQLSAEYADGFAAAMSQTLLLSVAGYAVCAIVVLFLARPSGIRARTPDPDRSKETPHDDVLTGAAEGAHDAEAVHTTRER